MSTELQVFLGLALMFGPPSLWAFHKLHKRSLARWAAERPTLERSTIEQRPIGMPALASTAGRSDSAAVAPSTALAPPAAPSRALVPTAALVRHLQRADHVLVVGPTNSGKTTAARAILAARIAAGEQVLIIDPHATPTTWGGLPAVGQGRAYAAISPLLEQLLDTLSQRYARMSSAADYRPPPLTVVVDEWPAIQSHCGKLASTFITELSQEGRKAGLRLLMLAQSDRVESLGIVGKGDVRANFTALLLGSKAVEAYALAAQLPWPAVLRTPTLTYAVDVSAMPKLAAQQFDPSCLWQPEPAPASDPLWLSFLDGADVLEPAAAPADEAPAAATPAQPQPDLPTDDLSQMLRALVEAGFSRTRIVSTLRFAPNRSAAFRCIRVALGEESESEAA